MEELVHLQSSLTVTDVVSVTARVCGVSDESILRRRQGRRLPRHIGMYCASAGTVGISDR